jgi:integration host factor subunit beta
MTKSDLIAAVGLTFADITQRDVELIVNSILEAMERSLAQGRRIELRGFGSFEVRTRRPRQARNPRTGAKVSVGTRRTVVFYPGKELSAILRGNGGAKGGDG